MCLQSIYNYFLSQTHTAEISYYHIFAILPPSTFFVLCSLPFPLSPFIHFLSPYLTVAPCFLLCHSVSLSICLHTCSSPLSCPTHSPLSPSFAPHISLYTLHLCFLVATLLPSLSLYTSLPPFFSTLALCLPLATRNFPILYLAECPSSYISVSSFPLYLFFSISFSPSHYFSISSHLISRPPFHIPIVSCFYLSPSFHVSFSFLSSSCHSP